MLVYSTETTLQLQIVISRSKFRSLPKTYDGVFIPKIVSSFWLFIILAKKFNHRYLIRSLKNFCNQTWLLQGYFYEGRYVTYVGRLTGVRYFPSPCLYEKNFPPERDTFYLNLRVCFQVFMLFSLFLKNFCFYFDFELLKTSTLLKFLSIMRFSTEWW